MKLRALFGLWEGESPVFLGAVEWDVYECEPENEWKARCEAWKGDWSVTETREVDIHIASPPVHKIFKTPIVPAIVRQEEEVQGG